MHPYLFQSQALTSLKRCEAIFMERGGEYADSWRNCRFSMMRSLVARFGLNVPEECLRMLALAGMVDQKISRQEGGYKHDSMDDGINYQLALAEEVRQVEKIFNNRAKLDRAIEQAVNGTPDTRPH